MGVICHSASFLPSSFLCHCTSFFLAFHDFLSLANFSESLLLWERYPTAQCVDSNKARGETCKANLSLALALALKSLSERSMLNGLRSIVLTQLTLELSGNINVWFLTFGVLYLVLWVSYPPSRNAIFSWNVNHIPTWPRLFPTASPSSPSSVFRWQTKRDLSRNKDKSDVQTMRQQRVHATRYSYRTANPTCTCFLPPNRHVGVISEWDGPCKVFN